jgi:hypothetical protein
VIERVAAIVVNWNGGDENLAAIRSLLDEGISEERLFFVDNASVDGSLERVKQTYPGVQVIENDRNLGYGDANNQAIDVALGRGAAACLLMNNDATLDRGCLAILCAALERDPHLGIVGPRVLYKEQAGIVWAAGGYLTFRQNLSTLIGHGQPDGERFRRTFPVDYVIGAVMLVRREVFETSGLLDGTFFAYHEDLDFCVRAAYDGFGVACVGEASAHHAAGHSTGGGYSVRRKYMIGVNTIWFLRRHGTPSRWLRFFVFDVLSLPAVWLVGLFRGRAEAVVAKARGLRDGWLGKRVTADTVRVP